MNINHQFNWQTFERNYAVSKSLLVKAGARTETSRITQIILNNMNPMYLSNFTINNSNTSQVEYDYNITSSFGTSNASSILSLPTTPELMVTKIKNDMVAFALSVWSVNISVNDIFFDQPGLGTSAKVYSNPSLAVNTSRQPSTTRDTMVNASVDITSTISLTTGQTGKVALQYADNTGFSTNVVTVQSATNGNTGSLTLGLNLSQVYTASLTGIIPAGKFYRLVTTNVTGTPTYGTPVIQEVLL